MALLSLWLGWLIAGRVLRPLRTITDAVRDISARDLHRRLALDGPGDELRHLGDTFDELLERLEASFEAQRRFVANASHELRTPLTLQRTLLQVALADPDADTDTLREMGEDLLDASKRQERLIDALLTLSRSQGGLDRREPIDLTAIAADILHTLDLHDLTIETRLEPAQIRGDADLVERLVANVLGNAVRHNLPHGRIEIATRTEPGCALLRVTNTGAAIPPDDLNRLFQPFQRLDKQRTNSDKRRRARPLHHRRNRNSPQRNTHRTTTRGRRPSYPGQLPDRSLGRPAAGPGFAGDVAPPRRIDIGHGGIRCAPDNPHGQANDQPPARERIEARTPWRSSHEEDQDARLRDRVARVRPRRKRSASTLVRSRCSATS